MWITVVETATYLARAKRLFTKEEREELIVMIAENPLCGDLMQGTGGARKVRVALQGQGKRGGARVIYYFYSETIPVFLLTVFGKSEKANLTRAERNELAALITVLVDTYARRKKR